MAFLRLCRWNLVSALWPQVLSCSLVKFAVLFDDIRSQLSVRMWMAEYLAWFPNMLVRVPYIHWF